ncbi:MAG: peptide chain release factor-like protein [Candidatus Peregrinibacteria bacterium]
MKCPPKSELTDKKYREILALINSLGVDLNDIEEKFIHGGGRGGQKLNKSSNAVQLKHLPTGTRVKYQHHRNRAMNRVLAFRELLEKLNPHSKKKQQAQKIRKQKKRKKRKYHKEI